MNFAARLQSIAEPGTGVRQARRCIGLCKDLVDASFAGERTIKENLSLKTSIASMQFVRAPHGLMPL